MPSLGRAASGGFLPLRPTSLDNPLAAAENNQSGQAGNNRHCPYTNADVTVDYLHGEIQIMADKTAQSNKGHCPDQCSRAGIGNIAPNPDAADACQIAGKMAHTRDEIAKGDRP